MTSWHEQRFACLDFETTGTDPFRDHIVTAALIEVGGGHKTVSHTWLIDPGIDIPDGAAAIHGITTEHVRAHGRPAVSAIKEIAMAVLSCSKGSGLPIVGHNVGGYDLTMLRAELVRHNLIPLANGIGAIRPVIDTMVIEKHLDPYRPGKPNGKRPDDACGSHKLIDCCRLWNVALSEEDAHGAEADALASGRLAWRLATDPYRFEQFDGPRGVDRINPADWDPQRLHDWQAEQYARSATSFQEYKRGRQRTKPEVVDPSFVANTQWPIQEFPAGWDPTQMPTPPEPEEKAS